MPPKTRRSEPTCSRCENEEDLVRWQNGELFCQHCLKCPHGDDQTLNDVCLFCLRLVYTRWTFLGPKIRDVEAYQRDAAENYGIRSFEILCWNFDEHDLLLEHFDQNHSAPRLRKHLLPPPHHRMGSP